MKHFVLHTNMLPYRVLVFNSHPWSGQKGKERRNHWPFFFPLSMECECYHWRAASGHSRSHSTCMCVRGRLSIYLCVHVVLCVRCLCESACALCVVIFVICAAFVGIAHLYTVKQYFVSIVCVCVWMGMCLRIVMHVWRCIKFICLLRCSKNKCEQHFFSTKWSTTQWANNLKQDKCSYSMSHEFS